jgi:hypothetical protein
MSNTPVVAVPLAAGPPTGPAAPGHTGMGSIPYPGDVTFRVWSMFADSVSVSGDFNGWTAPPWRATLLALTRLLGGRIGYSARNKGKILAIP